MLRQMRPSAHVPRAPLRTRARDPCQSPKPTISKWEPVYIGPDDSEEVVKLKHKVRRLEVIAENRKRRLNLMWQSKRRLRKKLERMKTVIKHLIRIKKDAEGKENRWAQLCDGHPLIEPSFCAGARSGEGYGGQYPVLASVFGERHVCKVDPRRCDIESVYDFF
ncbi:hypothetical protein EVAR_37483_1 [Eumeta japonica]|uniref:Uncharacterized protein n=1 Tax=Eumeta variegata TaxID=151549 RepID=A0A4C1XG88_EUMVA|nr:hypothetical protein EVAR_37483_1 [Eumeta japonica]